VNLCATSVAVITSFRTCEAGSEMPHWVQSKRLLAACQECIALNTADTNHSDGFSSQTIRWTDLTAAALMSMKRVEAKSSLAVEADL
jgi:hypothetical protein